MRGPVDGATLLTLVLGAALAAVCFGARGGTILGARTATDVALIVTGALLVAAALLLAPRGQRAGGMLCVALLGGLAAVTALSISWAVEPSDAWLEANRLFAYLAAFAGTIALAHLVPDRWASVIGAVVLACVAVCGYALLTKALPGWLNETELFARLREPYGYWNAVGLTGALAVPGCLWLGSRREGSPLLNALAYPALALTLATTLMAYSRGSLLAAAIGTAAWFALSPLRLRGATVLIGGGAGAAMIAVWAFGQEGLTTDRAPLADREAAGLELLVLVLAVLALMLVAGLVAGYLSEARPMRPGGRRRTGIALLACVALAPFLAAGALATTDEGLGGSLDNAWTSLTDTSAVGPANDPGRLTATGSVRSRYWDEAFTIWRTDELTGVGAAGFATARPRVRQDLLDVRHAHGFVPETLAELGLLGLSVSLALLLAWLFAVRRALRRTGGPERAGLVTLTATAVVFGAHATVDWTWSIPGTAVIGLVAAAWVAARAGRSTAPRWLPAALRPLAPAPGAVVPATPLPAGASTWRSPARVLGAVAVLAFAAVATWTVVQPLRADNAADAALTALEERRFDDAREHAVRARELNPLAVDPLFDRAAIEQQAGDTAAGERALEEAVRLQPANWLPWSRLADYRLFVLNDAKGAEAAVRSALYLNPRSWDITQRYLDVRRRLKGA